MKKARLILLNQKIDFLVFSCVFPIGMGLAFESSRWLTILSVVWCGLIGLGYGAIQRLEGFLEGGKTEAGQQEMATVVTPEQQVVDQNI
jgi:hypothetical protein